MFCCIRFYTIKLYWTKKKEEPVHNYIYHTFKKLYTPRKQCKNKFCLRKGNSARIWITPYNVKYVCLKWFIYTWHRLFHSASLKNVKPLLTNLMNQTFLSVLRVHFLSFLVLFFSTYLYNNKIFYYLPNFVFMLCFWCHYNQGRYPLENIWSKKGFLELNYKLEQKKCRVE